MTCAGSGWSYSYNVKNTVKSKKYILHYSYRTNMTNKPEFEVGKLFSASVLSLTWNIHKKA